jgi:hypothetical protein
MQPKALASLKGKLYLGNYSIKRIFIQKWLFLVLKTLTGKMLMSMQVA